MTVSYTHLDVYKRQMLKGIEAGVFQNCESIEKISLPKGLTEIGNKAFYKCTSLKDIELPEGIRIIGNEAFYQTAIQEIKLPSTLVEIGNSAFLKCRSLELVQIPASVKRIGRWSFHGCGQLKKVEFLGDPEEIGEWIINKLSLIHIFSFSSMVSSCYGKKFLVRYDRCGEWADRRRGNTGKNRRVSKKTGSIFRQSDVR